uniref:Uncharacterized protein n=1 Tax=Rhizophora mucronata TaxID=61149 RepID=A0A2P2MFT7_RHIMU
MAGIHNRKGMKPLKMGSTIIKGQLNEEHNPGSDSSMYLTIYCFPIA